MIHYILGNHGWYAKRDQDRYYATNYEKEKTLTAYDTNYTFRHGYHFDKYILSFARAAGFSPPEDVFNVLAEFDGDIYGNHQERLWKSPGTAMESDTENCRS